MNRALTAIFVVIISLPLAANLAGVDGADPGAEHRELARLGSELAGVAAEVTAAEEHWLALATEAEGEG